MAVITISRQFGCGAKEVSQLVAQKLDFKFFHKELIHYISILSDTEESKVTQFDEESHSTMRSIMSGLFDADIFTTFFKDANNGHLKDSPLPPNFFDNYNETDSSFDSKKFRSMIEMIVKNLAQETNSVIIGRGSQCILENEPNCFHLRLVAPFEYRVKWYAEKKNLSGTVAAEQIKEIEKRKKSYIKHYYGRDIDDETLYHGIINISRFSQEEASDLIAAGAKSYLKF